jgi:phosphohistidine phosphatase
MSKNLWLIRHAKSSWNHGEIQDSFRPLNERGYRDAPEMAARLHSANIRPDLIITSHAIRAYSTAMIFAGVVGYPHGTIRIVSKLYDASTRAYLEVIQALPDQYNTVFLFAHNPTISNTLELLAGLENQDMPTCGMAHISFDHATWSECAAKSGKLMLLDFPKSGFD